MPRYIDINDTVKTFKKLHGEESALLNCYTADWIVSFLESQPTADVQEVRHGEWMETQEPLGWRDVDCIECSVCHESWIMNEDSSIDDYECMWHHCPNCGAKMKGGEE